MLSPLSTGDDDLKGAIYLEAPSTCTTGGKLRGPESNLWQGANKPEPHFSQEKAKETNHSQTFSQSCRTSHPETNFQGSDFRRWYSNLCIWHFPQTNKLNKKKKREIPTMTQATKPSVCTSCHPRPPLPSLHSRFWMVILRCR